MREFRNYAALELRPQPGLNLIVGRNAQGKSNLLEAIAMLATGKSFRARRESELIRSGGEQAEIVGDARIAAGAVRLHCRIEHRAATTRKRFDVNGATVGYARFLGRARVVTFVPGDLQLVAGGPALRRTFLNRALAQISPLYYQQLARYERVLRQKSALLRGAIAPDRELLLAYNDELVAPGSALLAARAAFVAEIADRSRGVYERWAGADERLEAAYQPNVGPPPDGDWNGALAAALAAAVETELRRRAVLVGPHRDDVTLRLDGRALAAYGSQGQQRTAVLALKVAEYELMLARTGDAPLLLLDDVLSELDAERAAGLLGAVTGLEQAFLTSTEPPPGFAAAGCWRVSAGTLAAC